MGGVGRKRAQMVTLQDVIDEAERNDRVCPQPRQWKELYEMLPDKRRKGTGWDAPLPFILAAWWDAPEASKILRLREHIRRAADHNCLSEIYDYFRVIPEDNWHHMGE